MQVREFTKKKQNHVTKEVMDERIKKMRKEHDKLVKGRFEFTDAKGGWIDFSYRYFPGDPITLLRIYHDELIELPMGVVKHINNTYKKVRRYNMQNLDGMKKGQPLEFSTESRMKFVPVDFI